MNQTHQSHHSSTGLTSHIFYAYDAFSYLYVSSFYFLSLTMKNPTNQIVADPGLMFLLVRDICNLMLKLVLIELFLFESKYQKYVPIELFIFESEYNQ